MGTSAFRRFSPWLPAAIAVLVIAIESSPLMSSADTSRWLLPIWKHLFGPITAAHWAVVHHLIRKCGHFSGYGIVSLCFFHAWRKTLVLPGRGVRALWVRCAMLAVPCAALVASADEFHQSFLPSRTGSPVDVALDTCGAILAQLIVLSLMPLLLRRRPAPLPKSFAAAVE